jgi:hypothetical protein
MSLTSTAGGQRGLGARLTRVAVGLDADLIALRSDPAENVSAVADVAYAIRGVASPTRAVGLHCRGHERFGYSQLHSSRNDHPMVLWRACASGSC